MATPAAVLNILVRANTASANLGLAKVNAQARLTAKRFDGVDKSSAKTSKSLAGLGTVAKGGAVAGFIALGAAAKAAFDEFEESEKATRQTQAVIKSTGGAAKVTATQIEELANQISLKSGIDDEAIQSGENLLLTFTKIRNETGKGNDIFNRSTQVITDMSVALGTSLKSAAIQVGKALQDPEKGITALRRVGVSFTTTQQDMITNWAQHGQQLKAQRFILRELTKEFGGSAAAQATSSEKLTVAWNNMLERFGKAFGPTLEKGMAALARFINQMQTGKGAGGEFARTMEHVGQVLKDVFVFALPFLRVYYKALFGLIGLWIKVGKTVFDVGKAIVEAVRSTFNFVKKIVGDVIAGVLRRFATLFDVAAKIPGIGGKFKDLAADVRRSADRVDQLGENIDKLPKKVPIKVQVDLLMKDFLSGDVPRLQALPHGGPRDAIESGAKKRGRQWALDHLDQIAPLLGAPGSAPGTLGVWEQIGHRMGLVTTSGYRPGDPGFHGQNRARDLSGSAGAMLRYARFMYNRFGTSINELIHTPLGVGIDNHIAGPLASLYPPATLADHYDHVHVALQRGGGIPGAGSGDRVPALLEPGEFVMNRKATAQLYPLLAAMNAGIPRFATGGAVKSRWGQGISGKEMPSFLKAIWQYVAPMMGATGPVPRTLRGVSKGSGAYAEWWPNQGAIHFSRAMAKALANPKSGEHAYALSTIFHEMAHAWQDFDLSYREREGGADLWAGWAAPQVLSKLGVKLSDPLFAVPPYGYPKEANWVNKNRSRHWWTVDQFRGKNPTGKVPGFASGGLVAKAAYKAGFRGNNLLRAVAEAWGESGWNERAVGDGGASKGLMQIHTGYHPWARSLNLFDPFVNMRAAMRIFRSQGWGAWHADHRPGLARARAAIASLRRGGGGGGPAGLLEPHRGFPTVDVLGGRLPSVGDLFGRRPTSPGVLKVGQDDEFGDGGSAQDLIDAMKRQAEELAALRAELKRTNDYADSVNAVGMQQAWRALADNISGQIGGYAGQRARSAGDGVSGARY